MKLDKRFLEVYNETFKFIHAKIGENAVKEYWLEIAPILLEDLKKAVKEEGLFGCVKYWDGLFTAEGAEFLIKYKPNRFEMTITRCPAEFENPYKNYCKHCKVMYEPLFRELGYTYKIEAEGEGCHITVSK